MNDYQKSIDWPGRTKSVQGISYKWLASSYSFHFYGCLCEASLLNSRQVLHIDTYVSTMVLLQFVDTKAVFPLVKVSTIMLTVTHDCTCLGHLGWHTKNGNEPISVVLPKVAKASTIVTAMCHCRWHFCLKNIANVHKLQSLI